MIARRTGFGLWLGALALLTRASVGNAADGLAFVGSRQNKVGGLTGLHGIAAVVVSPDGANVYVASSPSGTVTTFTRDPATGSLAFVDQQVDNANGVDGLDHVHGIALSPDGTSLYAVGELDDAVAVFARDRATGRLTYRDALRNGIDGVTALSGPRTVVVSPDGAHVYVGTTADKSVVTFRREPDTGALAFVAAAIDGAGGVSGLSGVDQLALSSDGLALHAASANGSSVGTFSRDPASGTLTWVGRLQHGYGSFDGLDGVKSVAVSPDGRWLFAAGTLDDAIAVLARGDGGLTLVGRVRNRVGDVAGLDAVDTVAVSPDGARLYAAASKSSSVTTFTIDSATGALTFLHQQQDGVGTIEGLASAAALAVSGDGRSVYVGGTDAVDVFSTRCGDGIVDAGEQCDDGNAANGDGCSAGCRRECGAAADCADGDACTTEVCRVGECAMPECGLRGAMCQLTAAIPAMQAIPTCLPAPRRFGGTLRIHLREARALVQLVRHPPPPTVKKNGKTKKPKVVSPHTLDRQVGKVLTAIELKAGKLAQRGIISPACVDAVQHATEQLRSDVASSILGKGLCAAP